MDPATLLTINASFLEQHQLDALLLHANAPAHPAELRVKLAIHAYYGLRRQGAYTQLLTTLESLSTCALDLPDPLRFELAIALASVQSEIGLLARSLALLTHIFEDFKAPDLRFQICYYAFYSARRADNLAEAQRWLDRMFSLDLPHSEPRHMAYMELCRASLAEAHSRFQEAREAFTLAIRFAQSQQGRPDEVAGIISSTQLELARLLMRAGDFEQARLMGEDTIARAIEHDNHILTYAELYVGIAATGAQHMDIARTFLLRAAQRADAIPLPRASAHAALYLAWHAFVAQDLDLFTRYLRECAQHDTSGDHACAPFIPAMQRLLSCLNPEATAPVEDLHNAPLDHIRLAWLRGQPAPDLDPHAQLEPLLRIAHAHLAQRPAPMRCTPALDLIRCGDQRVDLSKRGPLRRILQALILARRSAEPWRSTVALFEAGWPEQQEVPANGFRRVYTELHRLKELGIQVESGEQGYMLAALPVFDVALV